MDMQRVESTNIKAIGHDPATNTLRVEFRNGGVYDYSNISPEKHASFLTAASKGKHFHRHIRGLEHTKVA